MANTNNGVAPVDEMLPAGKLFCMDYSMYLLCTLERLQFL